MNYRDDNGTLLTGTVYGIQRVPPWWDEHPSTLMSYGPFTECPYCDGQQDAANLNALLQFLKPYASQDGITNFYCPASPGGNSNPYSSGQWWLDQMEQGTVTFVYKWDYGWKPIVYDSITHDISISLDTVELVSSRSGKKISSYEKDKWKKEIKKVELIDSKGKRVVERKDFNSNEKAIFNLKKYKRGTYKVVIYFTDKIKISRVISKKT
jgi:hypothetical protein